MNEETDELDLEIVDELYSWTNDPDEIRRAYILSVFNFNPDIHIDPQLQALNSLERWVKGQSR